ncbi:MAG TPA: glycosyltransferase family 39 protein [Gemmatimonadaceae bacterium]|nr:glycosyltransferase family 39 protein [Gemmatimonadaceae bacterium]
MIALLQAYLLADPRRLMRSLFVLGFLVLQAIFVTMVLWPRRHAFVVGARELGSDWRAAVRAEPAVARLAVIALTFVGFVVRAYYVTCPMRGDESETYIDYVRQSWWTALSLYSAPNNHVLNTLLEKLSITALGPTVWALRLPALLAGVALIPAGYAFARAQFSTAAALVTAALLTASAPLIVYSVNGRGYTLLCLAFLLSVPIGAYALRTNNVAAWIALAVTNALGFFAVPVMVYPFGATMIWFFIAAWRRREIMISIAVTSIATLVLVADLYAPVAIHLGYRSVIHNNAIAPQPWAFFWTAMPSFLDQDYRDMTDGLPPIIIAALAIAIVVALIFNRRLSRWSIPLLVPSLLWSIALTLASHRVPYTRIYIPVAIVALTTAAAGITGWSRVAVRWSSTGAVVGAIALLTAFVSSPAMAHSLEFVDASPIADALRTQLRPGDGVITPWWTSDALHYYLERDGADIVPLNTPPWDSTDPPRLAPAMARRYIVITPRPGEQALDSLLRVMGVDPTSFDPPSAPLRFSSSAVYFVTRSAPR